MKFKRILSVCLAIILAAGCFASCSEPEQPKEPTADELMTAADQVLTEVPYKSTFDMTFTSNKENETTNSVTSALNGVDISYSVNGNNIEMSYLIKKLNNGNSESIDMTITGIDDTLYVKMLISASGTESIGKMKATATEEQRDEVMTETSGTATDITSADFEKIALEKVGDSYVLTCTDLKKESEEKLNSIVSSSVKNGTLKASNAIFVIEIKDGRYHRITLTCDYKYAINQTQYDLSAVVVNCYSYENVTVTAPEDADDYIEIKIDSLLKK